MCCRDESKLENLQKIGIMALSQFMGEEDHQGIHGNLSTCVSGRRGWSNAMYIYIYRWRD